MLLWFTASLALLKHCSSLLLKICFLVFCINNSMSILIYIPKYFTEKHWLTGYCFSFLPWYLGDTKPETNGYSLPKSRRPHACKRKCATQYLYLILHFISKLNIWASFWVTCSCLWEAQNTTLKYLTQNRSFSYICLVSHSLSFQKKR